MTFYNFLNQPFGPQKKGPLKILFSIEKRRIKKPIFTKGALPKKKFSFGGKSVYGRIFSFGKNLG